MKKGNRRRRQKLRKAHRAAMAAQVAQRAVVQASEPASDPLTDISALKVSPEDLPHPQLPSGPMRWCVARCGLLAERKVIDALRERRIVGYLPLHRFYRRIRGHRHLAERPLMVGYVLVGLAPNQAPYDLASIDGVVGLLQVDGSTAFISPWSVLQIALLEASGAFDHTGPMKPSYTKDQIVRIVTGWATGHQAKVVEVSDGGLLVQFTGVFKGSPVPVPANHVELVEGQAA